MNRLADRMRELCPTGVHFKRLGDVVRIRNGKDYKTLGAGDVPVYGTGGVMTYVDTAAFEKPSVLIPRKGSLSKLYYVDIPFWTVDTIFYTEVGEELVAKYLYYYLLTQHLEDMNQAGGVPSLTQSTLNSLRIPVPPLEVQHEIVRILDELNTDELALGEELEAESVARRKQYEYHAGILLTSAEDVARVKLGDIATIVRGASPRPIQSFITTAADGVPWIKIGDVPAGDKFITSTAQRVTHAGAAKSRRVHPGDFVLSNSMSFGRPYISKIEGCIHDGWLAISDFSESFLSDYLYYLLRSAPIQTEFAQRAGSGTVRNLNADIVKSVEVPVPPKGEQKRIVRILDEFDALEAELRASLAAELRARRAQYEYYRDRLFSFEELAA